VSVQWVDRARRELLSRRGPDGSWGYRDGGSPAVEPTALASLALLATEGDPASSAAGPRELSVARAAATWLAGLQREDGSLPAAAGPSMPGWATPYAMLVWSRLAGFGDRRRRARGWLMSFEGRPMPSSAPGRGVLGHDPTLIGWPWVGGTHSWLEPTAMAILALCNEGCRDHPRVHRGLSLIRDRAIPGGGWNYGNNVVFGHRLRPQPGPTGIALLALAARGPLQCPAVPPALEYLRRTLPTIHAAASLGWGIIGLNAHRACPHEAASWLHEAYERCTGRPDAIIGLSLLLLSAGSGPGCEGRYEGRMP
jgi:hypothetical protein